MKKIPAFLILGLAATVAAGAQERKLDKSYKQDGVYWAASWDEALKEAQARNVPIHFTVHKDG